MEKGPAASSEVSDRAFQAISFDAVQGKVIIGFLSYLCLNMSFNFHVSLPVNYLELTNIALFLFCICVCLCSLCKVSMVQNVWTPRVKQLYSDDMCRICPTRFHEGLILFGYLI